MIRRAKAGGACLVATGVDFLALAALIEGGLSSLALATAAAATIGALANFVLQRRVVFGSRGKKRQQLPLYLLVALATLCLSTAATVGLATFVGLHYLLSRALGSLVVFLIWNYPMSRLIFEKMSGQKNVTNIGDCAMINNDSSTYLSVIVPAYNEEKRLPKTLRALDRELGARGLSHEILVVDDGSTDRTAAVVEEMAESLPQVKLLGYGANRGKGFAVKHGVENAKGSVVLFMDADNSVTPDHVGVLLDALEDGADVAIGSRYLAASDVSRPQPWYRVAWSRFANFFVQAFILKGIKDTQCGFKAFRATVAKEAFSRLTVERWGFDMEILTILRRMGRAIVEVPVAWRDDRATKISPIKDAFRVTADFLHIQKNLLRGRYDPVSP